MACCCCKDRTCALIIGVLQIISNLIGIIVTVPLLFAALGEHNAIFIVFAAMLVIIILDFVAGCYLVMGVLEENTTKLTAWLIISRGVFLVNILEGILIAYIFKDFRLVLHLFFYVIFKLYFISVVINYRNELLGVQLEKSQDQIATVP